MFSLLRSVSRGQRLTLPHANPPSAIILRGLRTVTSGKRRISGSEELKGFREPTRLCIERQEVEQGESEQEYTERVDRLSSEFSRRLESLARTQQVTLNSVVQAAWALLLSRYCGSSDVLFGATVSGRPPQIPGIESMVGCFINALPVRMQVSGEETVSSYLKRVQARQAQARAHEYSPLVKMQEWSELPHGTPLFDYIVGFQNFPVDAALRERIRATMKMDSFSALDINNYPLTLMITLGPELFSAGIMSKNSSLPRASNRSISICCLF